MGQKGIQPEAKTTTLKFVSGGYHGTIVPENSMPLLWRVSSNIHRLKSGEIKRARMADLVIGGTTSGFPLTTGIVRNLFSFADPTQKVILSDLSDVNSVTVNKLYTHALGSNWTATERVHPFYASGNSNMGGLWSRVAMFNVCYEINEFTSMKSQGTLLAPSAGGKIWPWGMIVPSVEPETSVAGGSVTTVTGRKYSYAKVQSDALPRYHISSPSPDMVDFVPLAAEDATIECLETGTISTAAAVVTGTGTNFRPEWVGMKLWAEGEGAMGYILSVASATSMTLSAAPGAPATSDRFFVYDPQVTHIRLYATADGGEEYLRYQIGSVTSGDFLGDNVFDPTQTTTTLAGLAFVDDNPLEPGEVGSPYSVELAMRYNGPPPIVATYGSHPKTGQWLKEWQERILVFGPQLGQTVYYSNIEQTTVGVPTESFAPLNQFTLPIGHNLVNGAGVVPTGLVLFDNERSMFKITGYLQDNVETENFIISANMAKMPWELGCVSPTAVRETPRGLFWITPELQLWWYDDVSFPRNVGGAIQNYLDTINKSRLGDIKMVHYRSSLKDWLVMCWSEIGQNQNDKFIVLDLNSFVPPTTENTGVQDFYPYDFFCEGLCSTNEVTLQQRLVVGRQNKITDVDYDGTSFKQGSELTVTNAFRLHALGNDDPYTMKELMWFRAITNKASENLIQASPADKWTFNVYCIDDDAFTFDTARTLTLEPGVDSVEEASQLRISPALFKLAGDNWAKGRRFQFGWTFPTAAGDFSMREIQYALKVFPPR